MAWLRSLFLTLLVLVPACPGETNGSTSGVSSTGASTTTDTPTQGTTDKPTSTDSSGDPVTTSDTTPDACTNRPSGDWNACITGSGTNTGLCGFVANGGDGTLTCLSPQSGNFNVCGIRDCVDDCDCWAPPKTGDAPAVCTVVFGGGGKACVLYCVNGQQCPDGMECASGTCYWPNP